MDISYIAINRIVEDQMSANPYYRKLIEKQNRVLLSDGRKMSDAQLLEKLKSFNVIMDKQKFEELNTNFLSAEQMSEWLIEKHNLKFNKGQDDWIWICLTILWERWFPERPGFEMIDDKMQRGYKRIEALDAVGACEIWLKVWNDILNIMDSQKMSYLDEFDQKFRGTESVVNWVQDVEMELWNAGLKDKNFFHERINFCEDFIKRFSDMNSLITENMKRALAQSYFQVGEVAKSDSLFREWLIEDPQWGWGWIGWSDCYWLDVWKKRDFDKGEQILKEGLAVPLVRDKIDMMERLAELYSESGREEEADKIIEKIESLEQVKQEVEIRKIKNGLRVKTKLDFGEEGIPLEEFGRIHNRIGNIDSMSEEVLKIKIGRNDPCPCGSGKKYKKCCGK
jgi:tetratricopeptide (TPR) repeat protein